MGPQDFDHCFEDNAMKKNSLGPIVPKPIRRYYEFR